MSWIILVVGLLLAGSGYYMHFGRGARPNPESKGFTGSWLAYGHVGAVLVIAGVVGLAV